jgi:hypothetical protein
MLQGSVLSYDWYKTGEGQGLLAHFIDPKTGNYPFSNIFEEYINSREIYFYQSGIVKFQTAIKVKS